MYRSCLVLASHKWFSLNRPSWPSQVAMSVCVSYVVPSSEFLGITKPPRALLAALSTLWFNFDDHCLLTALFVWFCFIKKKSPKLCGLGLKGGPDQTTTLYIVWLTANKLLDILTWMFSQTRALDEKDILQNIYSPLRRYHTPGLGRKHRCPSVRPPCVQVYLNGVF